MTQTSKLDLAVPDQRGLVEKFVDALIWVFYPVYLYQHGLGLAGIGWTIGIYDFVWRDLGYAVDALLLGWVANASGSVSAGFWLVAIAMLLSGLLVWVWGEETHPRLAPAGTA